MPTILVVDDNATNLEFLDALLSFAGHSVHKAADGLQALERVRELHPDLVITDIMMPRMGGVEFADRLHADPSITRIPIIFYTATYRNPEAHVLAESCSIDAVLAKPAEPQAILDTVARVLGNAPAPQLVPAAASTYPNFLAAKLPGYLSGLNDLQSRLRRTLDEAMEADAAALRREGLFESIQMLGSRLSQLVELGLTLLSPPDVATLLNRFCRAAHDAMRCRYVTVGLCDATAKAVLHAAASGLDEDCVRRLGRIDASDGLIGRVVASSKAIRLHEEGKQPSTLGLPPFLPPITSLLAVAIPNRSTVMVKGWICFADKDAETPFDVQDGEFASILASQLSLAYGNLVMYNQLQRHALNLEVEIAERRRVQEKLAYEMAHDHVTGLPRLGPAEEWLRTALTRAEADHSPVFALHLNIDRFYAINDNHGHATGDQVLRVIAERLCDLVRERGFVAHVAGDEFIILYVASNGEHDLLALAKAVRTRVEVPIAQTLGPIFLTCSLGASAYPENGKDAPELLREAKAAMRRARHDGRNAIHVFSNSEKTEMIERQALGMQLHEAILNGELSLAYQPQVRGRDWQVVGFESLLRWQHPKFGAVSPARIIPIAEELGLIVELGDFVLETACRQARTWLDGGAEDFFISVNVSSLQFQRPDFVSVVTAKLAEFGVPARCLEIELTESTLAARTDLVADAMLALKALGTSLALDDFGTGFSSLNYLRRFPLERLKIDQSFVRDIAADASASGICRAIIVLGHQLGMRVVAEGVETEAQVGYLLRNGCDAFQGYHFSRPIAPDQALELLRQRYMSHRAVVPDQDERTLLLVDDEENILSALARTLRRDGYRIFTATAASKAFDLLARHDIRVIVSDQRMPGMSGTEFLNRVKEMYPGTIRMILSGYTDLQAVTDAINRGAIYKFLTKPWNDAELREQILEAFRLCQSQRDALADRQ